MQYAYSTVVAAKPRNPSMLIYAYALLCSFRVRGVNSFCALESRQKISDLRFKV